jgi:hypothetical protein
VKRMFHIRYSRKEKAYFLRRNVKYSLRREFLNGEKAKEYKKFFQRMVEKIRYICYNVKRVFF